MPYHTLPITKKYYLSGRMRGVESFNFPAFAKAAQELREQGHEVFNPAERDIARGFDPTGLKGTEEELDDIGFDLRDALAADCEFICREATHIYMLPGWCRSTGATAECALAIALGLTIEGAPA